MSWVIAVLVSAVMCGEVLSDVTEYPQIVMLVFEDSVEQTLYDQFYSPLFNLTNPDQCTIGITFFISHDYTDYALTHDLWQRGHEIASYSISAGSSPSSYWLSLDEKGYVSEMYGMKEIASNMARIPLADITGSRSPFLQKQTTYLEALHSSNFSYDSSWGPTTGPPLFPFPLQDYPGLWEVPLNPLNATYPCSTLDSCTGVTGVNDTFHFLLDNFRRLYETGRAPFGMLTHSSWFLTDPTHYQGYFLFVEYLGTLDDVYLVTLDKVLDWTKRPTKLVDLDEFEPWDCVKPQSECQPVQCYYETTPPGGPRVMTSCVQCPPNYPWVHDPYGNNTRV